MSRLKANYPIRFIPSVARPSTWTRNDVVGTSMVPTMTSTANIVLVNEYTKKDGWELTGMDWYTGPGSPEVEMRSGLVVVSIVALALTSCASMPSPQDATDAVLMLQKYDAWAWAMGIALIWADLVLPVPQTVVIAALGIIYGTVLGGLLGSVGLITGGLFGYVIMLTSARRMVKRLVGPQSLNTMEGLFKRAGPWAIVLTRSLPYSVPEAMVFLAGLAGMRMGKFTAALTVGSVPTAFVFAAIGAGWADQPILALALSYALPIVLLPIALFLMRLRPS